MPFVRLAYPNGALTLAQKRRLAADLTEIVLDAEVDAVTESGKAVTAVQFQEAAPEDWAVGGELTRQGSDEFVVCDCAFVGGDWGTHADFFD